MEYTAREVIDLYLRHLEKRRNNGDFSNDAWEDARRELNRFAEKYGALKLSECRKRNLTEWLEDNPQWKSAWTRKRVIGTIVRPFLWAAEEEIIPTSPYRAPKKMRSGRQRRPAQEHEYVALMRGGSRPLRRALFFLRRTGARTCEMRTLLWSDVDFRRGVIVLEKHKPINQMDQPKPRVIGLDRAVVRFLQNIYRRRKAGQEYVFVNCKGRAWNRRAFAQHLHRCGKRLGLDPTRTRLSAYCFRHAYGTAAIEAGVGEKQLADQMGHTTTRMVSYYAQTAGKAEYLKRVAEAALKRKNRAQ